VSLKYKFSLLIVGVIFSILVVVCTALAYREINRVESELLVRDRLISENILPGLLTNLGDYYAYQYENYLNSVKRTLADHPDLVYFRIINADSEVIFETTEIKEAKKSGNPPHKISDPKIQEVIQTRELSQDIITVDGQRQIRIIAPYIDNFDAFRNLVEFHYSLDEIQDRVSQTILFFVAFFVGFTILGVGAAIFFVGLVTKPLVKLTTIAEKIAGGDLTQQAEITSTDEVGTLAKAFNQMVNNLKQKIEQLHAEHIKLEASINSLSVGYIMLDRESTILTINQTAKQILCASPTSPYATIADCTLDYIHEELKGSINLKAFINQCLNEKKSMLIKELPFQNRYLKIFLTPIITIGVIGVVILVDDITETKVMERSKDEFFSIASHELRTPLTAIKGNSSLIKEFYSDHIKDQNLSEMIEDIHESSNRLIGIVNDFLDMSRLEQGKMDFKKIPFDITEIINSIIKEYQVTGSQKQVELIFTQDNQIKLPAVYADPNKVKQVLINLIGNGLKFTSKGTITISTHVENNLLKVFVADTGRGISQANQNLLFRKFQQANTSILTRDTTKGTGLGLYISKLITEGMGGTIKLENSVEGHGTTFSFTIPLATKEQIASPKVEVSVVKVDTDTGLSKEASHT
jgi:signal transduction histidine kinase